MNLTIAIPAVGLVIAANTVINFLRYKDKDNGTRELLKEVREAQKHTHECLAKLSEGNIRQVTLLESVVRELQIMNTKM